jgi:putative peptidoglycan lipid II flippase
MNALFIPFIAHAGLALSIGMGALVNAGWLLAGLRRRGSYVPAPGWGAFALRVATASAVMGGALAWAAWRIDWIALGEQRLLRIGLMAACLSGAVLVYFGTLLATGLKLREFARRG